MTFRTDSENHCKSVDHSAGCRWLVIN